MSNNIELQFGKWNIGGRDLTLNGILHTDNDFNLELYSDEPISLPYYTDVIYGETHQGNAYTLYKCSVRGGKSTSIVHDYQSKYTYQVSCDYVIEGEIFSEEQKLKVEKIYFSVTNLNEWAFQKTVDIHLDDSSEYVITTNKVNDLTHKNEEFELSISYITMPDYNLKFTNSMKIETNTQIVLKFNNPTPLIEAHKLIYKVRDFISLCTNTRTYIKYISAKPFYSESQEFEPRIQIYGRAIEFENEGDVEKIRFYDQYISLEHLKNDFNDCMKNWFEKSERLKPVIDLYLSVNYHRTSNERHFLNLVQALEAFHRLTRENKVLPKEEHDKKMESIISKVPEQHQHWVKSKLAFSNEPSLHERLEDLLTPDYNGVSPHHVGKYNGIFKFRDKDKTQLIRDIKNTRNYNTHFDERLLKKSIKGEELYQLISLLKLIMEFYLLRELEVDEDVVILLIWEKTKQLSTRNSLIEYTTDSSITF